jgi:Na+-transporting NADH:ubiquinone oxidoreductase subunit NqrF
MAKINISDNQHQIKIDNNELDFQSIWKGGHACKRCDIEIKDNCKNIPCGNKNGLKRKDKQRGWLWNLPF